MAATSTHGIAPVRHRIGHLYGLLDSSGAAVQASRAFSPVGRRGARAASLLKMSAGRRSAPRDGSALPDSSHPNTARARRCRPAAHPQQLQRGCVPADMRVHLAAPAQLPIPRELPFLTCSVQNRCAGASCGRRQGSIASMGDQEGVGTQTLGRRASWRATRLRPKTVVKYKMYGQEDEEEELMKVTGGPRHQLAWRGDPSLRGLTRRPLPATRRSGPAPSSMTCTARARWRRRRRRRPLPSRKSSSCSTLPITGAERTGLGQRSICFEGQ